MPSKMTDDSGLVFMSSLKLNHANTDPNEFAVHSGNIQYNGNNINYGCTGGYVLHITQDNTGAVKVNGTETDIPDNTWLNVIAVCDFTDHTVDVTVTSLDGSAEYFEGTVNMDDTAADGISGLYYKFGRSSGGVVSFDNIKIFSADQLGLLQ